MHNPSPRSKAREFAFKFIYQYQLPELKNSLKEENPEIFQKKLAEFHETYKEKDSEHPDNSLPSETVSFAETLIKETLLDCSSLEDLIINYAKGWKINSMDKVDLSILLICTCELKNLKDTPPPVIINEGVNLAKKFGSQTSPSFINGVLDAISKG